MPNPEERALIVGHTAFDEAAFNARFGRVLAKLRGTDDFSPTRTSQQTGLDRAFLYAVERGEKGISLFSLFRIASASKLSPSEIVRKLERELAATKARE